MIVLLVLADEFGFIGLLAAPPLAAAIQIFAGQIIRATTLSMATPPAHPIDLTQPISVLQRDSRLVQARIAAETESAPDSAIWSIG